MNSRNTPLLSKSRFQSGLQCPLRLWYQCYSPDLAREVTADERDRFETGDAIGNLATSLYPGGILIEEDHLHHRKALESTAVCLDDPQMPAIFEAAFLHNDVRVRVDILERVAGGKWNLIEVKSSTSVKDYHLTDVAVQYYVLQGAGLEVEKAILLHLNNQYLYDGNLLDLQRLFQSADLTERVIGAQETISSEIARLREMLAEGEPPSIAPSRKCRQPFTCEFWEHCTATMPQFWVMGLSGIGQKNLDHLSALGVLDIRDIPESFPLSPLQARIRASVINQQDHLLPELEDKLRDVEFPLHFLDFETIGSAIPQYAGTRPYQTIPFQWSDHILQSDGSLEHRYYLCTEDKDPREEFILSMVESLGDQGSIFIYTTYETWVINDLIKTFPQHELKLSKIIERFKDLYALVYKYYYHPEFSGSFSLKSVLPALVPSMKYEALAIKDGMTASLEYLRMIDNSTTRGEKEKIRDNLLTYCAHDTMAMVKIREMLLKKLEDYKIRF